MYSDKIVLITGTSRGVGLEIAKHFIKYNATVIGLSRTASSIVHSNYTHFLVDIGDPEVVSSCFKSKISKQFKRIDILINNAAVMTSQYAMIMPIKNAVDMVHVNLLGVFFVSREAAKLMRGKEHGRIINIGSMASSLEPIGDSVYAATKSGIISLANVLAKELSPFNITCNTLVITAIETDMLASHSESAHVKINEIIKNLPIPRIASMDDILNVIDFFSASRSSYITAQTIYLGGIN
jgi:3-oxoacyl-[acyl-carrier protein] reductase